MVPDDNGCRGIDPFSRALFQQTVGVSGPEPDGTGEQAILADGNIGALHGSQLDIPAQVGVPPQGDGTAVVFNAELRIFAVAPGPDLHRIARTLNVKHAVFQPCIVPDDQGVPCAAGNAAALEIGKSCLGPDPPLPAVDEGKSVMQPEQKPEKAPMLLRQGCYLLLVHGYFSF